jgi:hypothetical protein
MHYGHVAKGLCFFAQIPCYFVGQSGKSVVILSGEDSFSPRNNVHFNVFF